MKWIYKKEVNRMGEVTQTLTNESIDMPVLDEYQTPTLVIKKDRFGFGIKFNLGGLELKGGYKIEKYYTIGCYNTYIEHKRLVDNGIRKYRFRFDEGQVEESNIDYFCKDESEFKIVSDFMFNLKESKRFIVELDTLIHGIKYYEFELEGLTELCDEHKIFQYKKPTPFEPYVPSTPNKDYTKLILISVFIICLMIWFFSIQNENTSNDITSENIIVDTASHTPRPGDWDDLSTMNVTKPKKKLRTDIEEEVIEDEVEYVIPIEDKPNYTEDEKEMINYLKSRFPNYTEEQISKVVKSNKSYNDNEPIYESNKIEETIINVSRKKQPEYETTSYNDESIQVGDIEIVKKTPFLKRLFKKNLTK